MGSWGRVRIDLVINAEWTTGTIIATVVARRDRHCCRRDMIVVTLEGVIIGGVATSPSCRKELLKHADPEIADHEDNSSNVLT